MEDIIIEMWNTLKPYLGNNGVEDAATDVIVLLAEHEIVGDELQELISLDSVLKDAYNTLEDAEEDDDEEVDELEFEDNY